MKRSGYSILKVKIGTFTRDLETPTGTQQVTGVGFQPSVIIFLSAVSTAVGQMSMGVDDGVSPYQVYCSENSAANTWSVASSSIAMLQTVANYYNGQVDAFDPDGFTMDWTRTGVPTGIISVQYMAIR